MTGTWPYVGTWKASRTNLPARARRRAEAAQILGQQSEAMRVQVKLRSALAEKETALSRLMSENRRLKDLAEDAEARQASASTSTEQEVKKLQALLRAARAECSNQASRAETLEAQHSQLVEAHRKEVDKLQESLGARKRELGAVLSSIQSQQAKVVSITRHMKEAEATFNQRAVTAERLARDRLKALEATRVTVVQLQQKLAVAERQGRSDAEEAGGTAVALTELQQALSASKRQADRWKANAEAAMDKVARLQRQVQEGELRTAAAMDAIEKLRARAGETDALAKQLEQSRGLIREWRSRYEDAEAAITELHKVTGAEATRLRRGMADATDRITALEGDLHQATMELRATAGRRATTAGESAEAQRLRLMVDSLKRQLATSQERLAHSDEAVAVAVAKQLELSSQLRTAQASRSGASSAAGSTEDGDASDGTAPRGGPSRAEPSAERHEELPAGLEDRVRALLGAAMSLVDLLHKGLSGERVTVDELLESPTKAWRGGRRPGGGGGLDSGAAEAPAGSGSSGTGPPHGRATFRTVLALGSDIDRVHSEVVHLRGQLADRYAEDLGGGCRIQ